MRNYNLVGYDSVTGVKIHKSSSIDNVYIVSQYGLQVRFHVKPKSGRACITTMENNLSSALNSLVQAYSMHLFKYLSRSVHSIYYKKEEPLCNIQNLKASYSGQQFC